MIIYSFDEVSSDSLPPFSTSMGIPSKRMQLGLWPLSRPPPGSAPSVRVQTYSSLEEKVFGFFPMDTNLLICRTIAAVFAAVLFDFLT